MSCSLGEYRTYIPYFFMGMQNDPTINEADLTANHSECFDKCDAFAIKMDAFNASFDNFDADDWAAPLYKLSDLSVYATDVFSFCQTTNFAKQLSVRTSSLSGLFDFISVLGVSALKWYYSDVENATNNKLWYALLQVSGQTSTISAASTALYSYSAATTCY